MTLTEFRLGRLVEAAQANNADLLVASLPANTDYISGYRSVGMEVLQCSEMYVLLCPATGRISYVASLAEIPSIVEVAGLTADLYCCGSFRFAGAADDAVAALVQKTQQQHCYASMHEALAAAILATGAKRVALDESRCPVPTWNKVAQLCPGVELFAGETVFMQARRIKHADEIAGLERSVEIAEAALAAALKEFKPGMTELELERIYKAEVCRLGADNFFFVATAAHRAAYSDTKNTDLAIQKGDMIRFDFGCLYQGYCSDIARTVSVGQPGEKLAGYYEALRQGTHQAIAAIKPGIKACEVFELAMKATRENGLPHYQRHHCGHGIGVECYDFPSIAAGDPTPLQENMTLCIETPYYELGWGGAQIENTIVVTANGARYLDKGGDAMIILEV